MSKNNSYQKYTLMSVKARMNTLQHRLNELGYNLEITCKRDRPTIKALMNFQKNNGITPNGVICINTYNKLFEEVSK